MATKSAKPRHYPLTKERLLTAFREAEATRPSEMTALYEYMQERSMEAEDAQRAGLLDQEDLDALYPAAPTSDRPVK
jgi:hypothetical protein